ncbi:MAG: multiple sugar transport system permease protein, partial [Solirubrobacteraceae bacterium]|nr:multiple sugar transport system permease protein [Solirubrobacteraceae bacterium]
MIGRRIRRRREHEVFGTPGLISWTDWLRPEVKWTVGSAHALLLLLLAVIGLGPLLWLAKSALSPTVDTLTNPMALFPHGVVWTNLHEAW